MVSFFRVVKQSVLTFVGVASYLGLMEKWFPVSGDTPVGIMSASSELADMYTDKLRRMMLQSEHKQLVHAGIIFDYTYSKTAYWLRGW